jgi:two-component system chemotaxis response regulator CheY
MVVEDYEAMRMLIGRCLENLGLAEVRLEASAEDALAALETQSFDLIISDYQMGSADGMQLLRSIREDPAMADTKFIMLTASADRDLVKEAVALGVDEYITKPIEPRRFRNTVIRILDGADPG